MDESSNAKIKIHKCDFGIKLSNIPEKLYPVGTCSVCHTILQQSRTYYGQTFCIACFHKYIWSPAKDPAALDELAASKQNVK